MTSFKQQAHVPGRRQQNSRVTRAGVTVPCVRYDPSLALRGPIGHKLNEASLPKTLRDTDIENTTVMRSVDSRLGNFSHSSESFGI